MWTRQLATENAAATGVRVVAQSVAFAYTPGPGAASEDTRLWLDGPPSVEAVAATEAAAGTSLRCGLFYGPRFPSWRQGFESL